MKHLLAQQLKRLPFLFLLLLTVHSCDTDDDATVDACLEATNIQASNITSTTATIAWNDTNGASSFSIEYGLSGFAPGSGTTLTVTTTTTSLSNLEPNTNYDIYIEVNCSANSSSSPSDVYSFTTELAPVIPEFRTNLSELNLFTGNLSDLNITPLAFEYELNTPLFSDYSHKQRFIALPEGTTLTYDGDGLPIFPDNALIAKTFFYNADERDLSLGRTIIETRILIKINGEWESGDYKWNADQSDAVLDLNGSVVPISWIDADGMTFSTDYEIPSNADCFTCHNTFENMTPIGPKLRNLNFDIEGSNQLDNLINDQNLTGIANSSEVSSVVNWQDTSASLESRARSYFDINCAHCHIPGGTCADQSTLNLAYETSFENSQIYERRNSISNRISVFNEGFSMPFIGTTLLHTEGVDLLREYLDSL